MVENSPLIVPRRTLLKGVMALGGAAVLTACGDSAPSSSGGKTIKLTDQLGKVLTFDGPVRRIVTIPMPAAAMMLAVDRGAEHVVGMNEASWTAVSDGIMGSIYPAAKGIRHNIAGTDFAPNIESILALKPDVVVQWANQGAGLITPLTNAGLPVLGVKYGKLDDVEKWLTMFSTMLGKPQRGVAMNARISADRDAVAARTKQVTGPAPKVLYFLRFADTLTVTGSGSFNDEYIKLVGATNAAAEIKAANQVVDIEQILKWDPDIILLGNFDTAMPEDVYGNAKWKTTSAVKSHRVYKVPFGGYRWDPPSHESPLMWNWLSAVAFPGAGAPDVRAKIADDYTFLYGVTPTKAEIDTILWLDSNGESADYRQFSG